TVRSPMLRPNKRLKLPGANRSKGSGVLCPGGHGLSSTTLAPAGGSPAAQARCVRPRSDHRLREDTMAKQLACDDLMKGCKFIAKASNEQELLKKVASHAAEAHGVKEISPELLAKVRSAMKEVPA